MNKTRLLPKLFSKPFHGCESRRQLCTRCLNPARTCYCRKLRPFRSRLEFVLLQHPNERRRTIGTGRMTHLCLENSQLIAGAEFSDHPRVNQLISSRDCVVLYPGANSVNISQRTNEELQTFFPIEKAGPVVFVIDGTWTTAQSMLRRSPNLQRLPRICFTSEQPSGYRFRQQPRAQCFSTIEAVSKVIEILDPRQEAAILLELFSSLVDRQVEFQRAGTPSS